MSETIAIMIIWFGTGYYTQFDIERFDSLGECEAAKTEILDYASGVWGTRPNDDGDIVCREVRP